MRSPSMHKRMKRITTTASAVMFLSLPLILTGSASAAPQASVPAPPCVKLYESWRYVAASNDCADTMTVAIVYQDGASSLCSTLAPGTMSTVGEGYLGRHGHADHLALCEPS
ncbi:hypothetical protein ACF1A5_08355 [Streptomyces sp. NPDC014864]|uniref:hypothetical protein n=1 Tax=Streptomyces sp. NPDC014864 TaxID=3364924 RepID=UPI0036FB0FC0